MAPPIKDIDKTVKALSDLSFFRTFAQASFNRHVEAVYWKDSADHKDARKALLITSQDTQISIANKQLLFFFSLEKFTQQVEERVNIAKGMAEKDPNMVRLNVQLSPSMLYYPEGHPVGKRYISVPHIDESKLGDFRNFTFTHGSTVRLYVFADKKQIKVRAFDVAEGNRAINQLLKLVEEKWKLGTAEDHGYTGLAPKDMKTPRLQGITSKCHALHVYHPHEKPYKLFV